MNDYLPTTSFEVVGPAREITSRPLQTRSLVVQEGPSNHPNFRIHGWTFHVRGIDMRLSMHINDPPSVKQVVSSELEKFGCGALQQYHHDGAQLTDIVH